MTNRLKIALFSSVALLSACSTAPKPIETTLVPTITPSISQQTSAPTPTSQSSTWLTANSRQAGFTIKYPKAWKYYNSTNNGGAEEISLISPEHFSLDLLSFSENSTYAKETIKRVPDFLTSSCNCTINDQTEITVPGYGKLLVSDTLQGVESEYLNHLTVLTVDKKTLLKSPVTTKTFTSISGAYQGDTMRKYGKMSPQEFDATSDVQAAKAILKTLSY